MMHRPPDVPSLSQHPATPCAASSLLLPLRSALQILYSLPTTLPSPGYFLDHRAAHDFLIMFQSRNMRRKFVSLFPNDSPDSAPSDKKSREGSTFLACVQLLCADRAGVHHTERVFAAQTLLHRLRRMPLVCAIDTEWEAGFGEEVTGDALSLSFLDRIGGCNLILRQLISKLNDDLCRDGGVGYSEERYKGEVAMVTLSGLSFLLVHPVNETDGGGNFSGLSDEDNSLLNILSSSMTCTALRLKYPQGTVTVPVTSGQDVSATLIGRLIQSIQSAAQSIISFNINSNESSSESLYRSTRICTCSLLSSIPETLFCSGGARGGMSVDPKCLVELSVELRDPKTGVDLLLLAFQQILQGCNSHRYLILKASEKWARIISLPPLFLEFVLPIVKDGLSQQQQQLQQYSISDISKLACTFLTSLFESGSYTREQLMDSTTPLGLIFSNNQPSADSHNRRTRRKAKKRQASKQQGNNTNRPSHSQADEKKDAEASIKAELLERKQIACYLAVSVFDQLFPFVLNVINKTNHDPNDNDMLILQCFSACANCCVPYMATALSSQHQQLQKNAINGMDLLFVKLMDMLYQICSSNNRMVRVMGYEPLLSLHAAIISLGDAQEVVGNDVIIVDQVFKCITALASSCAYPPNYFNDLTLDNDEELENERNDFRDVLRSLTTGAPTAMPAPSLFPTRLLHKIVTACSHAIHPDGDVTTSPPESAVHTLSALAKPLVTLAERRTGTESAPSHEEETLRLAVITLGGLCHTLTGVFSSLSCHDIRDILPISRLASMATASFSPLFSLIVKDHDHPNDCRFSHNLYLAVKQTMDCATRAAYLSILSLVELPAPSTLPQSRYDIRGAMRGPGGEDHVGCLVFMRLVFESEMVLGRDLLEHCFTEKPLGIVFCLLQVHDELKNKESDSATAAAAGDNRTAIGTLPKSRRILLNSISHLGVLAMKHYGNGTEEKPKQIGNAIEELQSSLESSFYDALRSITTWTAHQQSPCDTLAMFRVCEATLDLASFPPEMTKSLFSPEKHAEQPIILQAVQSLIKCVVSGYQQGAEMHIRDAFFDVEPLWVQWGRLRCAVVNLIHSCANPTLPSLAEEAILALSNAECEAISACIRNHNNPAIALSPAIFSDSVIGEETIPAGAFLKVLNDNLENVLLFIKKNSQSTSAEEVAHLLKDCVTTLDKCKHGVFGSITDQESSLVFLNNGCTYDPRTTLAESWYSCMLSLSSICLTDELVVSRGLQLLGESTIVEMLAESCSVLVLILLSQRVGDDDASSNGGVSVIGMTMDAPHTLVLVDFLETSFSFGSKFLGTVGTMLGSKMVLDFGPAHLDRLKDDSAETPQAMLACVIIQSAFLRSLSGGLPPWAMEGIPKLQSALFHACGKSAQTFFQAVSLAVEARQPETVADNSHEMRQQHLAGKFIANMSCGAKTGLLEKVKIACELNNLEEWRRLKVILKVICGGKKKACGYNLKPALTNWVCDRP